MAQRGFTLAEVLVATAVLALLAVLAAPGFGEYLRNCRRSVAVNALVHAVHAARSQAAAGARAVQLCPSLDARRCSGTRDWNGWLLIAPERPAAAAAAALPPRVLGYAADGHRHRVRGNRDSIRFAPLEFSATTATLTVCDDRGARAARAVIVSRVGRPRVSDRDASGRALQCP